MGGGRRCRLLLDRIARISLLPNEDGVGAPSSSNDLAIDLRKQVREQLSQGKSEQEILDYMVQRYGDFVRYRPPVKMQTLVLWMGPFLLLAGGLFALMRFLRRRRQSSEFNDVSQARLDEAARLLSGKENRQ